MKIGEQSYAGDISSEVLEQQNSESFGCRGVLVSEFGLYSYLVHHLLIKRILLPILCCVYFMYIVLMTMCDYVIYMLFI